MSQKMKKKLRQFNFWSDSKSYFAIAHRGGAYGPIKHAKENTLEVFLAVSSLGYKYIEMDVVKTVDDKVIVVHVAKNQFEAIQGKRDAPGAKQLQRMNYEEVKRVLGRDIPTLQQVLNSLPDTKFLIDAKTDEVIPLLALIIADIKAQHRVCIGSFYPHRLKKLRELLGEEVTFRLNISRSPMHLIRQLRYLLNTDWREANSISAVDLPYIFLSKWMVGKVHRLGLKVLVWTPNSNRSISRSLRSGADGVISDNVTLLKQIILEVEPKNTSLNNNS